MKTKKSLRADFILYDVGWVSLKLAVTLRKIVSPMMALTFFGEELGMKLHIILNI